MAQYQYLPRPWTEKEWFKLTQESRRSHLDSCLVALARERAELLNAYRRADRELSMYESAVRKHLTNLAQPTLYETDPA